jgi:hypothetical protein
VTRLPPLNGILPRDSQSRKESKSKNDQNGIRVDEDCTIHWGVLSFYHSHLVDSSSSKVLCGSHRNRADTLLGDRLVNSIRLGCDRSLGHI